MRLPRPSTSINHTPIYTESVSLFLSDGRPSTACSRYNDSHLGGICCYQHNTYQSRASVIPYH